MDPPMTCEEWLQFIDKAIIEEYVQTSFPKSPHRGFR